MGLFKSILVIITFNRSGIETYANEEDNGEKEQ